MTHWVRTECETQEQKKLSAALRACAKVCQEMATADSIPYGERSKLFERHYRASIDAYNWLRFVEDEADRETIGKGIFASWEAAKEAGEAHRQALRDEALRQAKTEYWRKP